MGTEYMGGGAEGVKRWWAILGMDPWYVCACIKADYSDDDEQNIN
jgi:hypothetical protein